MSAKKNYSGIEKASIIYKGKEGQSCTLQAVLEEVIQNLGLDLEYKELQRKVSVGTPEDTRVIYITVEDNDPIMAMHMANSVRETASRHIENVMDIDAVNVVETANMPTEKADRKSVV